METEQANEKLFSYHQEWVPLPRRLADEDSRFQRHGRPSRRFVHFATAVLAAGSTLVAACALVAKWQSNSMSRPMQATDASMVIHDGFGSARTEEHRQTVILKALQDLDKKIKGDVYFQNDSHFEQAQRVWCMGADSPLAVIQVASEKDVQTAVPILAHLSQEHDFPFRIRSGGHHKAGFSTVAGGAVLALVRMDSVELMPPISSNRTSTIATMGPALTVGKFLSEVLRKHGYGGVVGYCPQVAEGGFLLGGGLGLQSRLYGLAIDNVESMRVVLSSGRAVSASKEVHSDLFWALRGAGGGSFGVVTSIDYRVHKASDYPVFVFAVFPAAALASILHRAGQMEQHGELPGQVILMVDGRGEDDPSQLLARFAWSGTDESDMEGAEVYLTGLIQRLAPEEPLKLDTGSWQWSGAADSSDSPAPTGNFSWEERVWKAHPWCGFLHAVNNTEAVWRDIMQRIAQGLKESPNLVPDIELWGGAIGKEKWNTTAFPYRSAIYNVGVLLMVEPNEPNAEAVFEEQVRQVNAWWPEVSKYLTGSYVNYPSLSLGDSYPLAFWGDNLAKLTRVKQRYDADNVFNFPMSVPLEL